MKMKKTMNFIIHSNLLSEYLATHNLECIMHTTTNGEHSEGGFGYKYIKPIFTFVSSENKMLKLWCNNSSPIQIYIKWMYYCLQKKNFLKSEFDYNMGSFFCDYDKVYFRKHRSIFYCVMSVETILTESHEEYINSIIDYFLN